MCGIDLLWERTTEKLGNDQGHGQSVGRTDRQRERESQPMRCRGGWWLCIPPSIPSHHFAFTHLQHPFVNTERNKHNYTYIHNEHDEHSSRLCQVNKMALVTPFFPIFFNYLNLFSPLCSSSYVPSYYVSSCQVSSYQIRIPVPDTILFLFWNLSSDVRWCHSWPSILPSTTWAANFELLLCVSTSSLPCPTVPHARYSKPKGLRSSFSALTCSSYRDTSLKKSKCR